VTKNIECNLTLTNNTPYIPRSFNIMAMLALSIQTSSADDYFQYVVIINHFISICLLYMKDSLHLSKQNKKKIMSRKATGKVLTYFAAWVWPPLIWSIAGAQIKVLVTVPTPTSPALPVKYGTIMCAWRNFVFLFQTLTLWRGRSIVCWSVD
jgi:hypothetical protein